MAAKPMEQKSTGDKKDSSISTFDISNDMTLCKVAVYENVLEVHARNNVALARVVNAVADISSTIAVGKVNFVATGYFLDIKKGKNVSNLRSYVSLITNDSIQLKQIKDVSKFLDTEVTAEIRNVRNNYNDRTQVTTIMRNIEVNQRAFISNGKLNERTITRTNGLSRATLDDPPPLQINCLDLAAYDKYAFTVRDLGSQPLDLPLDHQQSGNEDVNAVFQKTPVVDNAFYTSENNYYTTNNNGAAWYDFPSLGDIEQYAGSQIRQMIENSKEYRTNKFFVNNMRAWVSSMNRIIPGYTAKDHISSLNPNPLNLDDAYSTNSTVQVEVPRGMRQTFRFAASFGRTYTMGQTTNIYTSDTRSIYLNRCAQTIEEQTTLVNAASIQHFLCKPKLKAMTGIDEVDRFIDANIRHEAYESEQRNHLLHLSSLKKSLASLQDQRKNVLLLNLPVTDIDSSIRGLVTTIKDLGKIIRKTRNIYKVKSRDMKGYNPALEAQDGKNLIDSKMREIEKTQAVYRYEGNLRIEQVRSDGANIKDTYQSINLFYPSGDMPPSLSILSPNIILRTTSEEHGYVPSKINFSHESLEIEARKSFIRALSELTIELKNTSNSIKLSRNSLDLRGESITLNGKRVTVI